LIICSRRHDIELLESVLNDIDEKDCFVTALIDIIALVTDDDFKIQ